MIRNGLKVVCALLMFAFAAAAFARPAQAQGRCPAGAREMRPAGTTVETLISGGIRRHYRLYIPPNYDPTQPAPLIFSLHGFASSAAQQEMFSEWNAVADAHGLIIVYPQGTGIPARWYSGRNFFIAEPDRDQDVTFLRDLAAHLQTELCIDPARIYVNGLSNGGGMSNRLACEASDVFAAVGGVAGAYAPLENGCHPERPVPIILFHGTADNIVPYEGDVRWLPSIPAFAAEWAARNGCDLTPQPLPAQGEVSGIRYTGCADDAEVVLYTIDGGGHTWPGGRPIPALIAGHTTQDIDASAVMWDFFAAHALPTGG